MGTSGSKVPKYEIIEPQQQASTSDAPRPSAGSFSPPLQGLLQPSSSSYIQRWAPVQQAPPPPLPHGWDFHIDPATGYPYFYSTRTGVSQWQDPRGPGFSLPNRSDAANLGQRRQVIPPWEGGPTDGDPLSWPLPPGWQEQHDQATNQRYYVNYAARIISYNDPRLEIAKAYVQGPSVEGVPVYYPPPVIGRPVDEQSKPSEYPPFGPPLPASSSVQGGTSYLPPPPPLKKKKNSLWSKLGYRHGMGRRGSGGVVPPVFLFGSSDGGIGGGDSGSSSSSSSDDDDKEGSDVEVGSDVEAGGDSGSFSLGPRFRGKDGGGSDGGGGDGGGGDGGGGDGGGGDGGGCGGGGGDGGGGDGGGCGGGGGDGGGGDGGGCGAGGGGAGGGVGGGSDGDLGAIQQYCCDDGGDDTTVNVGNVGGGGNVSGGNQQPLFGFWQSQVKNGNFFLGWDEGMKSRFKGRRFSMVDKYTKIILVLTVLVGSYFGVVEGLVSFIIAFSGRLMLLMCTKEKMMKGQQKRTGLRFRDRVQWVLKKKGSTPILLKTTLVSQFTQIQAWFYEHLYEHPLVRVRMLAEKDKASPLYSRLKTRPREITIVTQASADRLPAIEAMAKSWGGAICVAMHVRTRTELQQVYPILCSLHERIEAQGLCRLDVCVAKEEGLSSDEEAMAALYPINAMRNIALSMATTELVFILDADFVPSMGMHELLTGDETAYSEILRMAKAERQLLVVPALEAMTGKVEGLDISQMSYPTEMCKLREQWKDGSAKAFHCSHFPRGHNPTNYENFFNPSTLKPYRVQYREFYEPYVICAREVIPPFDARFRGYGLNKISHAYHCAMLGMGFSVLPNIFVWSLPHRKSQAWVYTFGRNKDPSQKLKIVGLYRRFKSDVQLQQGSDKEDY